MTKNERVKEICERLKSDWRAKESGGCRLLQGRCDCHLCLIDELAELAKDRNAS